MGTSLALVADQANLPAKLTAGCRLALIDLTLEESAFVEMFLDARRNLPETDLGDRLPALVAATLPRAQAAGLVSARLSVDDVMLAQRMVYGVVATSLGTQQAADAVHRALALLQPILAPTTRPEPSSS